MNGEEEEEILAGERLPGEIVLEEWVRLNTSIDDVYVQLGIRVFDGIRSTADCGTLYRGRSGSRL